MATKRAIAKKGRGESHRKRIPPHQRVLNVLTTYRSEKNLQFKNAEKVFKFVKDYKKNPILIHSSEYEIKDIRERITVFSRLQKLLEKQKKGKVRGLQIINYLCLHKIHPQNITTDGAKLFIECIENEYGDQELTHTILSSRMADLLSMKLPEFKKSLLSARLQKK